MARTSVQPAPARQTGYHQVSQWPLQVLLFLLPAIAIYEVGTLLVARVAVEGQGPIIKVIAARSLLRGFFEPFGVTGYFLPGLVVVVVLLVWHFVRRDPVGWHPRMYGLMWLESAGWAALLFAIMAILVPRLAAAAGGVRIEDATVTERLVFSFGAGIYEELLFRVIGIALLHTILVDGLALPRKPGAVLTVGLSALAFALYHFSEANPFTWNRFFQYSLAGVAFSLLYVWRGFGIAVGTHALYDVLCTMFSRH